MPTLDPNQNHEISREAASEMTSRFRNSSQFNGTYAGYFGKKAIQAILDQANCVGIRYYYGLNEDNQNVIILVGVTADNKDLTEGVLAEMSLPCPDLCDTESSLRND